LTLVKIDTIVFDIGGVLIDWDPRHLYRKILPDDPAGIEYFLSSICNHEWNLEQDAGRSFNEGTAILKAIYPAYEGLIEAYDRRWEEMLGEEYYENTRMLEELKEKGYPLYALTNWSAEKFPIALKRYNFLSMFDDIVVSGEIGMKKPDQNIFEYFLKKHAIDPDRIVFIDDTAANINTAAQLGMHAIHYQNVSLLRSALVSLGVL
jgi:2-haloacid dehalogenase